MGERPTLYVATFTFENIGHHFDQVTFYQVASNISYEYWQHYIPTTLYAQNQWAGADGSGLLYVPDLPPGDSCIAAEAPYIPANVTRKSDIPLDNPDYGITLVAIAPWLSPQCVLRYIDSARNDPVASMLFYLPGTGNSPVPDSSSSVWSLGDNNDWQDNLGFPVFAITGHDGEQLMQQSALYSGDLKSVPNGDILAKEYNSSNYVRLYADVYVGYGGYAGQSLPSLWVFLLVVLAILLGVIGSTSLCMHWLQRRRRNTLRRRVANGEVDLEALGIKRLTVPQDVLDTMPLYTYGSGAPVQPESVARETATTPAATSDVVPHKLVENDDTSAPTSPTPPQPATIPAPTARRSTGGYRPTALDQPSCPICLEDFIPGSTSTPGTTVRELPCRHIFHPECVDTFLRESSSLCPMCKNTALPKGYCPRVVTNAMVRRERMMRGGTSRGSVIGAVDAATARAAMGIRRGNSVAASSGDPERQSQVMMEMRTMSRPTDSHVGAAEQQIQPPSNAGRREWARQRAIAMLGRNRAPVDPDAEDAARTPGWRKVVGRIFPWTGR